MRDSAGNRAMTLCLALSYGGRESIVSAARALASWRRAGALEPEDITEERSRRSLQTGGLPPAGPADPHLGRGAAVELPALGGGLRGALLHRHLLARLRQRELYGRWSPSAAASAASAGPASRSAARAERPVRMRRTSASRVAHGGGRRCRWSALLVALARAAGVRAAGAAWSRRWP